VTDEKPTDGHWQIVQDNLGLVRKALALCRVRRDLWDDLISDIGYDVLLDCARTHKEAKGTFANYAIRALCRAISRQIEQDAVRRDAERVYAKPDSTEPEILRLIGEEQVSAWINRLPEPLRETFSLHYRTGFTEQQIGDQLGIAQQTVSDRLQHAKRMLEDMTVE